jgi:hypothetical protein
VTVSWLALAGIGSRGTGVATVLDTVGRQRDRVALRR